MTDKGVVSHGWLAANSTFTRADGRPVGRAFGMSLLLHGLALVALMAVMAWVPQAVIEQAPVREKYDLIFVQAAGPAGGGGGSKGTPDPPRKLEMRAELPKPPAVVPAPLVTPPPSLVAPIQTASPILQTAGALTGLGAAPSFGGGTGTGAGPGQGPGIGPGTGGGFGGGAAGPGSGALPPTLLRGPDPRYTAEAMRTKVQGVVTLEALVAPNGTVKDVRVVKSLDRLHGLDEEAMRTARQWLFRPATLKGQAVAYLVLIEMAFNLR